MKKKLLIICFFISGPILTSNEVKKIEKEDKDKPTADTTCSDVKITERKKARKKYQDYHNFLVVHGLRPINTKNNK